jgi:hypothetical protein
MILFRWTIGNTTPNGLLCLKHSIKYIKKFFPEASYYVLYNDKKPDVEGVTLIDQKQYQNSLPIPPQGCAWKLYPPRLNINAYEFFIDNDVIVTNPLKLDTTKIILAKGKGQKFGYFNSWLPKKTTINSGLFGLPPEFNFHTKIMTTLALTGFKKWTTNQSSKDPFTFDEQGMVALILGKENHQLVDLSILESHEPLVQNDIGYHFVQLNRVENHRAFEQFVMRETIFG